MRASFPMYARPEHDAAHACFWGLIRDNLRATGIDAPDALTSDGVGYPFWQRADLVLSQTCGYPYRTRLRDKVRLVGTPDYAIEGCPQGFYQSVFVVRRDWSDDIAHLATARFAYNDDDSQSGLHGPRKFAAAADFALQQKLVTGSHIASARAVLTGAADAAAIDIVTWRLLERYEPQTAALHVIAKTRPVPGLPMICALQFDPDTIANAYEKALRDLPPDTKNTLGIARLIRFQPGTYQNASFD